MRSWKNFAPLFLVLLIPLLLLIAGISCSRAPKPKLQKKPPGESKEKSSSEQGRWRKTLNSSFGLMPAMNEYKLASEIGAYFDRPHFEIFSWDRVEPQKGEFYFEEIDRLVKEAQEENVHIVANIQSYNHWDQGEGKEFSEPGKPGGKKESSPFMTSVKPKDMEAYKNFLKKLVERYDKDGKSDMPGLKYPLYFWEVLNEPEMQEPPLAFFKGSPEDYFEVLKASHEAIKEANPEAKVLHAGMAGMMDFAVDFWDKVFALGAGSYFDIANMHDIGHGEHLNLPSFKKFLAKYNIDKPIWITEVQLEDRFRKRKDNRDYAASLVRAYTFGLANGAEKFFYVNFIMQEFLPKEGKEGPGFTVLSALIASDGRKQDMFYAHQNLAKILNNFSSVEKLKETITKDEIKEGQYKFVVRRKTTYVLWGKGNLPPEIKGKVEVIDLLGKKRLMDAKEAKLSKEPIFVQLSEGGT